MFYIAVLCVCAVVAQTFVFLFSWFATSTKTLEDVYTRRAAITAAANPVDGEVEPAEAATPALLVPSTAATSPVRV